MKLSPFQKEIIHSIEQSNGRYMIIDEKKSPMKLQDIKIGKDYYIIDETAHTRRARAEEMPCTPRGYKTIFYIHSLQMCEKISLKNIIREAD